MPLTLNELDNFHRFAAGKLNNGAGELSLEECLRQWRAMREEDEAVADILEGLAQADAGMLRPFREVDAELRAKYGISVNE